MHTPELSGSGQIGACCYCGRQPTPEGHDGCIGELDPAQVMNACCGHGEACIAYIQYWDIPDTRGQAAVDELTRLGVGPENVEKEDESGL